MNEKQLLELKKEIEAAKERASELKGQLAAKMSELKTRYKCDSVESADKLLKTLSTEIAELEEKITVIANELAEKYEFD